MWSAPLIGIIGLLSSSELFNYTASGDTVNLAQRLQSSAKPGQILMHKNTRDIVAKHVIAKQLKPLAVKGREQLVDMFELKGLKS